MSLSESVRSYAGQPGRTCSGGVSEPQGQEKLQSVHTKGKASLKYILFSYDRATHSVIIGPVKLRTAMSFAIQGDQTVPGETGVWW